MKGKGKTSRPRISRACFVGRRSVILLDMLLDTPTRAIVRRKRLNGLGFSVVGGVALDTFGLSLSLRQTQKCPRKGAFLWFFTQLSGGAGIHHCKIG